MLILRWSTHTSRNGMVRNGGHRALQRTEIPFSILYTGVVASAVALELMMKHKYTEYQICIYSVYKIYKTNHMRLV